ncbi:MAG: CPBP family intramembrane metalloprotease [Phycisphaerae bacterium]|nr:CPBP family intramembrane metalloprotease [Phycisphaerae bacterium]
MSDLPPEERQPPATPIMEAEAHLPEASAPMLLRELSGLSAGVDLLLFVAIMLVYVTCVGLVVARGGPENPVEDHRFLLLALTAVMGILAVAIALLVTRWRSLHWASLGLTLRDFGVNLLLGMGTAVAAFGIFVASASVIDVVWPEGYRELLHNPEQVRKRIPQLGLAGLVALTVFVGLWEEVAFRGFILPRLRRLTKSWTVAVVLSSLVFAVLHKEMQVVAVLIPVFFLGVLFSIVTIWRGSLLPAVTGHFLFNLGQFISMRDYS